MTRENIVERHLRKCCEECGLRCLKLVGFSFVGFPDRTILGPNRTIAFVELKRDGKDPSPIQRRWKKRLIGYGFIYEVIRSKQEVEKFIERLTHWTN